MAEISVIVEEKKSEENTGECPECKAELSEDFSNGNIISVCRQCKREFR